MLNVFIRMKLGCAVDLAVTASQYQQLLLGCLGWSPAQPPAEGSS